MVLSRQLANIPAITAVVALLLVACPAAANPAVNLGGIDADSVLMLRDHARQIGYQYGEQHGEAHSEHTPQLEQIETLVIDPGHGGDNSGATGVAQVAEKYLTLHLAYQLRDRLQRRHPDLRVVMTRYHDDSVELNERVHLANLVDADLFLSLHYNAAPHDRAVGFETYYLDNEQVTPGDEQPRGLPVAAAEPTIVEMQPPIDGVGAIGQHGDTVELIREDLQRAHRHRLSAGLAETVQAQFIEHIDSVNRGVKQGNFSVLRGAHMPAVVVEAGFLTHPEEGIEVLEPGHRTRVTDALVDAIETYDQQLEAAFGDRQSDSDVADDESTHDSLDTPHDDGHQPVSRH